MSDNKPSEPVSTSSIWIIWGALLTGVIILPFLIHGGLPSGPDKGTPSTFTYVFTFAGFFVSVIIRWLILPKIKTAEHLMTTMIVGVAMAEGTAILGLFATGRDFVSVQIVAYGCAILGILQFAPTYFPKENEPSS